MNVGFDDDPDDRPPKWFVGTSTSRLVDYLAVLPTRVQILMVLESAANRLNRPNWPGSTYCVPAVANSDRAVRAWAECPNEKTFKAVERVLPGKSLLSAHLVRAILRNASQVDTAAHAAAALNTIVASSMFLRQQDYQDEITRFARNHVWSQLWDDYVITRGPENVEFDPRWKTSDAVVLARRVYETRDMHLFKVLADAIEEAGCTAEIVLKRWRRGPRAYERWPNSEWALWNLLDLY